MIKSLFFILCILLAVPMRQLNFSNSAQSLDLVALKKEAIISCAPIPVAFNNFYWGLETIEPNDNRRPAGVLKDGVLTIKLEAREGVWYPETPLNPGMAVYAFAEEGKPPQMPGPLIRVPEGTEINLAIRNTIDSQSLNFHGFHTRPGDVKDS